MLVSESTYQENASSCQCGTHTQHRVFRYKYANPSASRAAMSQALRMTPANVKKTLQRLRKADLSRRCPECFKDQVLEGVCHSCGVEIEAPSVAADASFNQLSPTNRLHAGNLLGSEVNYRGIRFENHWAILKRRMDATLEDSLLRGVKSDVMNELKRFYPSEVITETAGRYCVKEVIEFRANFPRLATSKNVRKQLTERVMKRLALVFGEYLRAGAEGDVPAPQIVEGDAGT